MDLPEEAATFNDTLAQPTGETQPEEDIIRILEEAKYVLNRTASEISSDYIDEIMDDEDDFGVDS